MKMAQCQKIRENGERCSNRVIPGTEYCDTHRKPITFKPITPKKVNKITTPPPKKELSKKIKTSPPAAEWVATPILVGASAHFPGLRSDSRNVLVAPEGLVWLRAPSSASEKKAISLLSQLTRLLSCISQEMILPNQVKVQRWQAKGAYLVALQPPAGAADTLSSVYDNIASAAVLCGGRLYIGQKKTFIQYRDTNAPHGYDAKGVKSRRGNKLCLVNQQGTVFISQKELSEEPLGQVLLSAAPIFEGHTAPMESIYALAAPQLYSILARYFRDHHLQYKLARFQSNGQRQLLFEVAASPGALTGSLIPAFIISYLRSLPRVLVLREAYSDAQRRILVAWDHRVPFLLHHVLEAFPESSLTLFTGKEDAANSCIIPLPTFFDGDTLMSVQTRELAAKPGRPLSEHGTEPLRIPLRLVRDGGPLAATAALILDDQQFGWLSRLLYKLPAELFSSYRFFPGKEYSLLAGEKIPLEIVPFGIAMLQLQDSQLFIPVNTKFVPELPWAVLAETLHLKDDVLTFITSEFRIDVPEASFVPLSRALVSDPERPDIQLAVRPVSQLPKLKRWKSPAKSSKKVKAGREFDKIEFERSESIDKLLEQGNVSRSTGKAEKSDIIMVLRKQAETMRADGDFLGAAFYLALAGDPSAAAKLFQTQAGNFKQRRTGVKNAK